MKTLAPAEEQGGQLIVRIVPLLKRTDITHEAAKQRRPLGNDGRRSAHATGV